MQTAIEVACDTIRILNTVVQTSDVYQAQQKTFNHFLESAISSLLLAVGHRKDTGEPSYFEELHMVMGLVRGLATKSLMMRKLCDKLERLKVFQAALKLGTQNITSSGSMQPTKASQCAADSPEAGTDGVGPLSTTAFTPVSDNSSRSHHGDSEVIPYTRQHGTSLSGMSPDAAYTAWIGTPQPSHAHLATTATESGYPRIPGVSCPPELASLLDPRSYGESGALSSRDERAQGGNIDALQYMFFADMQELLGQPDNTFTF